jgi:hypothetical protein
MLHYTLNTGHTRESPRSEVRDEVLRILRPLLGAGKHDLPIEGYQLVLDTLGGGALATVYRGADVPVVTIGIAPDAAAAEVLWPHLESLYLRIAELPGLRSADFPVARRPAQTPWVAAVVIGPMPREAYWLGDFERCLAWAWIESLG